MTNAPDIDRRLPRHRVAEPPRHRLALPAAVAMAMRPNSRDNARTPMQWDDSEHAGFTTGQPLIPVNPNHTQINAAIETAAPESGCRNYRRLNELRHTEPVIAHGTFTVLLPDHPTVYAFARQFGDVELLVLGNFSDQPAGLDHTVIDE
jgi:oligo-1,6-glucosidase